MAINDVSLYGGLKIGLTLSVPATTEQIAALRNEIVTDPKNRKYKNPQGSYKSPLEIFSLINDSYVTSNENQPTLVPVGKIDLITWAQFASSMLGKLRGAQVQSIQASQTPNPLFQLLIDTINEQDSKATKTGWVDTSGSAWVSFRPLAIALQATTDNDLKAIELKPDPNYQANIDNPSRASAICGIAELSEIVSILSSI